MSRTRKAILAAGLAVGLALAGAASAQAVTTQTNFNTIVPRFQQSHYWTYQNKVNTSASQVAFSFIGSDYTMNVKAQNGSSGTEYTEKKGIGVGSAVSISNGTPVGTATRLIVTNNTWALVDVTATGWFKTN